MFQSGRTVDGEFSPTEKLFIRCTLDWFDAEGHVIPAYVGFPNQSPIPNQSANRSKYSKSHDVLLPDQQAGLMAWLLWGVVTIQVSAVTSKIVGPKPDEILYTFSVEHEPEDDNYAHSELSAYKKGKREHKSGKINQEVKKLYREQIARGLSKIINPLIRLLPSEPSEPQIDAPTL